MAAWPTAARPRTASPSSSCAPRWAGSPAAPSTPWPLPCSSTGSSSSPSPWPPPCCCAARPYGGAGAGTGPDRPLAAGSSAGSCPWRRASAPCCWWSRLRPEGTAAVVGACLAVALVTLPRRLAAAVALTALLGYATVADDGSPRLRRRTFFGVLVVRRGRHPDDAQPRHHAARQPAPGPRPGRRAHHLLPPLRTAGAAVRRLPTARPCSTTSAWSAWGRARSPPTPSRAAA